MGGPIGALKQFREGQNTISEAGVYVLADLWAINTLKHYQRSSGRVCKYMPRRATPKADGGLPENRVSVFFPVQTVCLVLSQGSFLKAKASFQINTEAC